MLRFAVAVVVLVGLVLGQTKYCCTPPQWESAITILDGRLVGNRTVATITTEDGTVSVDGVGHMIAKTVNGVRGGVHVSLTTIQFYNNRTQYNIQGNVCRRYNLLANWTPKCVPDGAQLLTSTYYGLPNHMVDVDIYGLMVGSNTVFATMAKDDCTVYTLALYGSRAGTSAMTVTTFGNFSLGIKNRSVFDIPASCDAATQYDAVPEDSSFF